MLEGAIYSVIAPEGAATILYRDATRAPELSAKLKLTAQELKRLGIIDEIVPEPAQGVGADPDATAAAVAAALSHTLADLQSKRIDRVVKERYERYQNIGRTYARKPRRLTRLWPQRREPAKAG
jgi:acetyl-CoA carboxylase alpha subunit